jgi:hypothetical protein
MYIHMERLRRIYVFMKSLCVCTGQIQFSCLVIGRTTFLHTSGSTLSKSPHRNTFLEKPIKNREGVRP